MKLLNFFSIFLIFSLLASASYATVNTSALEIATELYYSMDNSNISGSTILDLTPNNNDGTISGATTGVSGILNEGIETTQNQYVNSDFTSVDTSQPYTYSFWFKKNDITETTNLFGQDRSSTSTWAGIFQIAGSKLMYYNRISGKFNALESNVLNSSTWYHLVLTYDGTTTRLYINNEQKDFGTFSQVNDNTNNLLIGSYTGGTIPTSSGTFIDEVIIGDRAFTQEEVTYLYNSGSPRKGQQFPYESENLYFQNITLNGAEFENNSFFNTIQLNFNTLLNSSNNNTNTNISYSLNGGTDVQFGTNTLNDSFSLNLSDGENLISFYGINNETNASTGNYTFTIDTTLPTITNNIPAETNSYFFNDSQFSCTDTNLGGCYILINSQNLTSSENTTLTLNGNISYTMVAEDNAGNTIEEAGTLFVNPNVEIYFYDTKRNINVSNFQIGTTTYSGSSAQIPLYDLPSTIVFNKEFYDLFQFERDDYNFTNNTQQFNITSPSMAFNVSDLSGTSITDYQLTITKNGIQLYQNQSFNNDEYLYYDENLQGQLKVDIQKSSYLISTVYIDLTLNSTVYQQIYLDNSSSTQLFEIETIQTNAINRISGVLISFYKYNLTTQESKFITDMKTDSTGKLYFPRNTDYTYKLVLSKDGYLRTEDFILPTDLSRTYSLARDFKSFNNFDFDGFNYKLSIDNTENNTIFKCEYLDSLRQINSVECSLTRSFDILFNPTLQSIQSYQDNLEISVPKLPDTRQYTLQMQVTRDGITKTFSKNFMITGTNSTDNLAENRIQAIFNQDNYDESDPTLYQYDPEFLKVFSFLIILIVVSASAMYFGGSLALLLSLLIVFSIGGALQLLTPFIIVFSIVITLALTAVFFIRRSA